jgi:hypothetical protein
MECPPFHYVVQQVAEPFRALNLKSPSNNLATGYWLLATATGYWPLATGSS